MKSVFSRRQFMRVSAACWSAFMYDRALRDAPTPEVHVCPKSRPPEKAMNALRLKDLTTDSWDLRLTLSCLQGIVNRSQPRLYLIHDDYDELWLNWLRERGDVHEVQWLNLEQIFARFLPEVSEAFIIDPNVPATINVATMLSSLRGGLVVTPRTADEYNLPAGRLPDSWKTGLDF